MSLHQIKAELCSAWGSDKDAANQAWASTYDVEKLDKKTNEEIVRMASNIVANRHDTPKERIWMDWFITCPIFVERQFDKYRLTVQTQDFRVDFLQAPFGREGITQNELSGRYRTIPDRPYEMPDDVAAICGAAYHWKQRDGRWSYANVDSAAAHCKSTWDGNVAMQHARYQGQLETLRAAEKDGVITNAQYKRAREVLRGELGTAYLTDMRLVMNLNAFEWIITQRIDEHAQLESRVLAYRLLTGARDNEVAKTIVNKMIEVNGWQSSIDEIAITLGEANVPGL